MIQAKLGLNAPPLDL